MPFQWNAHCNANFDGISVPHAYGYNYDDAQRYPNSHGYSYIHDHAQCYGNGHSYSYCETDAHCSAQRNTEGTPYPAAETDKWSMISARGAVILTGD